MIFGISNMNIKIIKIIIHPYFFWQYFSEIKDFKYVQKGFVTDETKELIDDVQNKFKNGFKGYVKSPQTLFEIYTHE